MQPAWRQVNLVCSLDGEDVALERKQLPKMRDELIGLFERTELSKYLTEAELAAFDAITADAPEGASK
jgi:succinate dehydrogenase / fumarate reductase flavoprotein subunit